MKGFVYLTKNIITNKLYVGKRIIKHNKTDMTYLGSGKILKNSIKKYGKNAFKRTILCYCETIDDLNKKESLKHRK